VRLDERFYALLPNYRGYIWSIKVDDTNEIRVL